MFHYRILIAGLLFGCTHKQKNVHIEDENYLEVLSEDELDDLPENRNIEEENEPEEEDD
jgi:hypothetical protein